MFSYNLRLGAPQTQAPVIRSKLAPSPQWDGVAGRGFGGAFPAAPVDPVRETWKPWCNPLFVNWTTFGSDFIVTTQAGVSQAVGGLARVEHWLEGVKEDLTQPTWRTYNDVNGVERRVFGYHSTLDYDAIMAASPTGTLQFYMVAVPTNDWGQRRVYGPMTLYAREPGVGAGKEHDIAIAITPSQSAAAGVRYPTLKGALDYCSANGFRRPLITITEDCELKGETTTPELLVGTSWATITTAEGVSATIGDNTTGSYTTAGWVPRYDGLRFKGAGLTIDLAGLNYTLGSAIGCRSGSNAMIWCDGCKIITGTPREDLGGAGSGAAALHKGKQAATPWFIPSTTPNNWCFTEVEVGPVSTYGISRAKLIRNVTIHDVSGSPVQDVMGAAQGLTVSDCGGYLPGLRVHEDAFLLSYDGAATVQFEVAGANNAAGGTRTFRIWVNNASSTPSYSRSIAATTSNPDQVTQVVDWVNGLGVTGLTATLSDPAPTRAACFLSFAGNPPSAAISKRTLSGSFQFTTILDIHSDGFVQNINTENFSVRFLTITGNVESAPVSLNNPKEQKDFCIKNVECQDTSALTSGATHQDGYISAACDHGELRFWSGMDTGWFFGSGFSATDTCYFGEIAAKKVYWSTVVDPDLTISGVVTQTGGLPSGADALSKALGGVETAAMFADPSTPDFTPTTLLQLANGGVAGNRTLSGEVQV